MQPNENQTKMRLVLLDLEGPPEALQAILRAALSAEPADAIARETVNVALVEANGMARRALARGKPNGQAAHAATPANGDHPAKGAVESKKSLSDLIRTTLKMSPKIVEDILEYVLEKGYPEYTTNRLNILLAGLRKQGDIERADDKKWHLIGGVQ
jgi:hypothetical protein